MSSCWMPIMHWPVRISSSILNWWISRALPASSCRSYGGHIVLAFKGPGYQEKSDHRSQGRENRSFQTKITTGDEQVALCLCDKQRREGETAYPEPKDGALKEIPTQMQEEGEPQILRIYIVETKQ